MQIKLERTPKKPSKNNKKFNKRNFTNNQPQPDLSDLIKKILLVVAALIFGLYCVLPLITIQDFMKYFQTQEFTVCLVLEILIIVGYNILPQIFTQQKTKSINVDATIPSLLIHETCDICNDETSISDIHYIDNFKICSKCIRKGIRRL